MNQWVAAERKAWRVPTKSAEQLRYMTATQQASYHARREKAAAHNAQTTRPCIFCGTLGLDRIEHYFNHRHSQNGAPECPVVRRRAEQLSLLEEGQDFGIPFVLGLLPGLAPQLIAARAYFIHSVWRQVDWVNRGGVPLYAVSYTHLTLPTIYSV